MFRALACSCLNLFLFFFRKVRNQPKVSGLPSIPQLLLHWFSNFALFFDAKEQKRAFTSARLSSRNILAKTWNYPQDRNCLACCWQKSSFCSSALHSSFSNLAPPSFPSLSLQYILFFGLNFSPFTNQN